MKELARTLQSIVILSGGSVGFSDDLTVLNEAGVELLRRTAAAEVGRAARPVDLFTSITPSLWVQDLQSGGVRIGVINWTDETVSRTVDVGELTGREWPGAEEFWTGEKIQVRAGKAELTIEPHETKLLVLE